MIQRTPPRDFHLPQLPGSNRSPRRAAAVHAPILALVLALGFASFGLGLAMPLLARASDAPAQDPPPLSPSGTQVHLPALGGVEGATACETWISIQLTGDEPSKAALVVFGAPGLCPPQSNGPLKVECTGLLFPGASWSMLGAQIPTGSQSGILFSFTARKLSEVGLSGALGFDDVVADTMCETLFFGVVGDGDDYRRFKKAYDTGGPFADIPQRIAAGGALAVNVARECASAADPARKLGLTYSGVPGGALGSLDPSFGGFAYFLPQVVAKRDGLSSHVYIHNAGLDCAAVELWFEPRSDVAGTACDTPPTRCALLTLPPGESKHVDVAAACAVEGQAGGVRLRSTVPLAAVADTVGAAAAASYTGRADGAPILLAPLVLGDHADWSTLLHVQNLDLTGEARAKATFLDRSGEVLATAEQSICPGGTASFDLDAAALPEGWIGSARLESLPRPVPGAADRMPSLVGVAEMGYRTDAGQVHELVTYGLVPVGRAPDGQAVGDPAMGAGAGMLALPTISKSRGGDDAFASELVIANTVTKPGFTNLAMYVYDQNGLLDSVCSRLQDRQVEVIDLRTWGLVNAGFRGSVVISATSWDHAVFDPSGNRIANPVGLAAVVLDRPLGRSPSGAPIAVDGERAATGYAGIPIALPIDRPFDPDVFRTGCPGDQPRPTRPPTMTPLPTATPLPTEPGTPPPTAAPPPTLATPLVPSATQLHLPILSETDGTAACDVSIDVQNVGDDPSKVVLIAWGDPGNCSPQANGPLKVECSGLIAPGTRWSFSQNQLPAGARSAAIFSFTGKQLSEIGVDLGFDDVVADLMCEELFFGIVGDADDYRRFKQAFDSGGVYRGIPQFLAAGSPLAAFVHRSCPNPLSSTAYNAMYSAVPGSALGSMDPIAGGYAYTFAYAATGRAEERSRVHVQNASEDCASVEIWFRPQPATLDAPCDIPAKRCATFTVAPGESRAFDVAETCGVGGDPGSVWLRSTSELAAVMDTTDRFAGASTTAGTSGAQNLIAPLIYHEFSGWDTRIHVQNLSAEVEARVKVTFQDRSGDTLTSLIAQVCPQSSRAFDLASVADLPGSWVGSARVEVQPLMGPGGIEVGPDLLGVVQLVQPATADRPSQMIQYNLLPAVPARTGAAPASGAGMIALPAIHKGRDTTRTTEIAIANLVTQPGYTDFALYLYDQNGLLDFVCMKLNDHQVEYIDLATWGMVRAGFSGTAVISAVFWEHDVFDPNGMFVANLVGLGAVVVEHGEMKLGAGPVVSEAGGSEGIPLTGADAAHFRPLFGASGCQSGPAPVTPRATSTALPTPTIEATATVAATPTVEPTETITHPPTPASPTPTAPPSATPPESTPTAFPTATAVIPTLTSLPPTATSLPPTPRPSATDAPTGEPTATVPVAAATATPIAKVCETIRSRVPANVLAAALADPAAISGYNQLQYPNRPPGPFNLRRTWLTLSDVGRPWNRLYNALVFKVGCR